jgi:putative RecB family exonuclease
VNFDVPGRFNREFDKAILEEVADSGFEVKDWIQIGGPATAPNAMVTKWRTMGPECVQAFIDWYESSGYQVWITPDGRPAIELELRPMFGQIEVVMYVDLVLYKPDHLLVVDLKSGSKQPDSPQQLGMYACGVELTYGVRPYWAAYFMNRKGGLTKPVPTLGYGMSIDFFTKQLAAAERGIEAGVFVASPGSGCAICGVSRACAAVGGDLADQYDPSHPDHSHALSQGV